MTRPVLTYFNNKHIFSSSFEVHYPFPLVDTQRLLLSAHSISSIKNNKDIGVRSSSKNIACEGFNLIRNN